MKNFTGDHQVRIAAAPLLGFGGRKASNSIGKLNTAAVLRLRAAKRRIARSI
jgi:hypothetical protein